MGFVHLKHFDLAVGEDGDRLSIAPADAVTYFSTAYIYQLQFVCIYLDSGAQLPVPTGFLFLDIKNCGCLHAFGER